MKHLRNLLARLIRRRRIRAARIDSEALREFVYLDEVSVYSLLASRQGALATEYTHTETRSVADGFSSSTGGSIGPLKSETSSRSEVTQSQSTQVLRKSSVQAAFRDLRLGEEDRLVISPLETGSVVPHVAEWRDVDRLTGSWVIDPVKLSRGDLIEIEVELQAERIYRYLSIFTAIQNIIQEGRTFFDSSVYSEMKSVEGIKRILTGMLVGLVPVRCRAVNYKVVKVDGRQLIVHDRIREQLPALDSDPQELYIVGVTEEALFWKDVRRVLFSGSRYRMMCRLNHGGLRSSWSAVKLTDMLEDIAPGIALEIERLEMPKFEEGKSSTGEDVERRLKSALVSFGRALARDYKVAIGTEELEAAFSEYPFKARDLTDVEVWREAFGLVVEVVSKGLSETPEPDAIAQLRTAAILESGLDLGGEIVSEPQTAGANIAPRRNEAIVDTEIVAIYW